MPIFPHTPYAEDQPLAKTILTTHVLTRGFQAGTILGVVASPSIYYLRCSDVFSRNFPKLSLKTATPFSLTSLAPKSLGMAVVSSAGVGAMVGTAVLTYGLVNVMKGKEDIEWKDRSWRLMENRYQAEIDSFTYSGCVAGSLSTIAFRNKIVLGWSGRIGVVALGGLGGLLCYGGWRYGIHGGRFDEKREESGF